MEININKIPILVIKFMKSNEIEVQMGIKEEAQCKRNHNLTQSLNLTVTYNLCFSLTFLSNKLTVNPEPCCLFIINSCKHFKNKRNRVI